jgi:predicted metalloprotease
MRFRPGARLDPSQVEDRRGITGGPAAVGGGGLGLVVLVVYVLFQVLGGGSSSTYGALDGLTQAQQPPSRSLGTSCQTGADANTRQDCRILGDVNSIQT